MVLELDENEREILRHALKVLEEELKEESQNRQAGL